MWAVDLPDTYNIETGEWRNIDYFETEEEAIAFAKKYFGADDDGMICVISDIGE